MVSEEGEPLCFAVCNPVLGSHGRYRVRAMVGGVVGFAASIDHFRVNKRQTDLDLDILHTGSLNITRKLPLGAYGSLSHAQLG